MKNKSQVVCFTLTPCYSRCCGIWIGYELLKVFRFINETQASSTSTSNEFPNRPDRKYFEPLLKPKSSQLLLLQFQFRIYGIPFRRHCCNLFCMNDQLICWDEEQFSKLLKKRKIWFQLLFVSIPKSKRNKQVQFILAFKVNSKLLSRVQSWNSFITMHQHDQMDTRFLSCSFTRNDI